MWRFTRLAFVQDKHLCKFPCLLNLASHSLVEKEMATYSSILAWEIHGQRSLADYSAWGRKSQTPPQQSGVACLFLQSVLVLRVWGPVFEPVRSLENPI